MCFLLGLDIQHSQLLTDIEIGKHYLNKDKELLVGSGIAVFGLAIIEIAGYIESLEIGGQVEKTILVREYYSRMGIISCKFN